MKRILIGIVAVFYFLLAGEITFASQKETWRDNFSGSNLRWTEVYNSQYSQPQLPCRANHDGQSPWQIKDSQLLVTLSWSEPCKTVLVPSEAPLSSEKLTFRFELFLQGLEQDRNFYILWQDERNYLGFHMFNNRIYPEKKVDGRDRTVHSTNTFYPFKSYTPYTIELEYDPTIYTLKMKVNDTLFTTVTEKRGEPQITHARPALAGSVGAVAYSSTTFDSVEITVESASTLLPLELLKQTDSRWSGNEYDSAHSWSTTPSFGRWGCAVTSAAMLLRFHQIKSLPDGSALDPGTLNSWLRSQPDGYIGSGLVNWRAITRLTAWHKSEKHTPALEYSYISQANDYAWLRQEFAAQRPVILEQPGHFIVAHGSGAGEASIAILDPFYPADSLAYYDHAYLSARQFRPSHTDLSAILLVSKQPFSVTTTLSGHSRQESSPDDPTTAENESQTWFLWEAEKPPYQEYSLQVQALSEIDIFTYDQQAQVKTLSLYQSGRYSVRWSEHGWEIPAPQPVPALTAESLRSHLAWGDLHSPFFIEQILALQERIQNTTTPTETQQQRDVALQKLEHWKAADWLSAEAAQRFRTRFEWMVTEKWP